jgi:hypothetical protein
MDVPPYFTNNDVGLGTKLDRFLDLLTPGASVQTLPAQGANKRLVRRAREGAHQ